MFDNLREDANSSPFFEDEKLLQPDSELTEQPVVQIPKKFLGLTPMQRFILSVLIMVATCVLGLACLLLTGNMVI